MNSLIIVTDDVVKKKKEELDTKLEISKWLSQNKWKSRF